MNESKVIKALRAECSFLEEEGFEFSKVDRNIKYKKEYQDKNYCIRFNWGAYNSLLMFSLYAFVGFNELEDEITEFLGIEGSYYTIYTALDDLNFEVKTDDDVRRFAQILEKFYNETVKPFFEKYTDLDKVYEHYSTLEEEEINGFILNTGNSLVFYRELLLLLKYDNRIKAKEFYDMVMSDLIPLQEEDSDVKEIIANLELFYNRYTLS